MNAADINKLFREKAITLGSVESFTGGMFASEITAVPGASHFFKGGLVTYMTEEKVRLLGIPYEVVDQFGVVSKEAASLMAIRGAQVLNCDVCVSFTGNAGPEAMENKPAGRIYIGVFTFNDCEVYEYNLKGTRDDVRRQALDEAYRHICEKLSK